jgi:signal peptidase I
MSNPPITPGTPSTEPPGLTAAQRSAALREVNRGGTARFLVAWFKVLLTSLTLFIVLRTFIVEAFKIPSGSMEHTLLVGDFLLVNKLAYGAEVPVVHARVPALREPRRGDVIVFKWSVDPSQYLVKRVVGIPGDTLEMRGSVLIRNGQRVRESYAEHIDPAEDPVSSDFSWQRPFLVHSTGTTGPYYPSRDNWGPLVVPPERVFVLGDNRDDSSDSRYWGFVADSTVKGSPMFVYFSYEPDSASPLAWVKRIRWTRLGEIIR